MTTIPQVGTVLGKFDAPLTRARVWRVDWSVGLDTVEYQDPEVAREAGMPDIAVPPGSLVFFSFLDDDSWLEASGVSYERSLAVRRQVQLHRQLYVGDVVRGTPTVSAVEVKERGDNSLVFVTISTDYECDGSVAVAEHVTYMTR
ncbi:MAG TPA: MaoC family dehydratase N-terminal domain-containing protein, partial [Acidimicrobiia bacterium]|nr:MaoC family dehydratase N-terminal domain-containing protein [Acidimicrobiia bacterium]